VCRRLTWLIAVTVSIAFVSPLMRLGAAPSVLIQHMLNDGLQQMAKPIIAIRLRRLFAYACFMWYKLNGEKTRLNHKSE